MIIITKGSSSGLALGPLHLSVLPYFPGEGCQGPALTAVATLSGILGWAGEQPASHAPATPSCGAVPGEHSKLVWGGMAQAGKARKNSLIACSLSPSCQANARIEDNPAVGETLDRFLVGVSFPKG